MTGVRGVPSRGWGVVEWAPLERGLPWPMMPCVLHARWESEGGKGGERGSTPIPYMFLKSAVMVLTSESLPWKPSMA